VKHHAFVRLIFNLKRVRKVTKLLKNIGNNFVFGNGIGWCVLRSSLDERGQLPTQKAVSARLYPQEMEALNVYQ